MLLVVVVVVVVAVVGLVVVLGDTEAILTTVYSTDTWTYRLRVGSRTTDHHPPRIAHLPGTYVGRISHIFLQVCLSGQDLP
jgi:hypothetical protein